MPEKAEKRTVVSMLWF